MLREKTSTKKTVARRQITPPEVETAVLIKSRRRCPLCVGIAGDTSVKEGQIAHLDQNPANYAEDDFGILKGPTSAVCFGPPWVKRTSSLDLSDELGSGGGGWTGEPRWSYTSRSGVSMSLAQGRLSG